MGIDSTRQGRLFGILGATAFWCMTCSHDPYTVGPVCHPGETRPCYEGPAGTEGVGSCQAGYRKCDDDLEGFGECQFQVLPAAETCTTKEDDNCDGTNDDGADCQCENGAEEACYGGPEGTEDVGECRAGHHACVDGLWEPCGSESVPTAEDCTNLLDEDCDGIACAAPLWGVVAGDAAEQRTLAVAADASGNVIVAGYFAGTLSFGGEELVNVGGADAFVVKLDAKGKPVWSRSFATAADEVATAVAVGPDGSIVIAGYFTADLKLGNVLLPNKGGSDAFIAKLSGDTGEVLWATKRGYSGNQRPTAVTVAPEGEIILAGSFSGYLNCPTDLCGLGSLQSAGGTDGFVMVFDGEGVPLSIGRFGGAGDDRATALTLDGGGHVIAVGDFQDSADFGEKVLTTAGSADRNVFVATLAMGDLSVLDATQLGDASEQRATGVAWNGGGVVLTGTTYGIVDFGFAKVGQPGSESGFVAQLGGDKGKSWAKAFSSSLLRPAAVATGTKGIVAVAGTYGGAADFGVSTLNDPSGTNAFLLRLDQDGAVVWAKSFGESVAGAFDEGCCVATAPNGDFVFGGSANSALDFGLGTLPYGGGIDAAAGRFSP